MSKDAVVATRGVVLTYGKLGEDRIFKTYFSSCCGGLGQNPVDAFITDPPLGPLEEKNAGGLCQLSPRYSWGPVTISKAELSRRIRVWGQRRSRPEGGIASVRSVTASHINRLGRPVRYLVTDSAGARYSLAAEELRTAINTDANGAGGGRTVYSGWMSVVDAGGGNFAITGRGSGHAVGMCQFCAEALALKGWRHEDILRYSYPGAQLVRGY
jgi:stage II sporulation protein D